MRRILVAEDDSALRLLYGIWLGSHGYDVTAVADGRAAIAMLERGPLPDAAVLDVDMPFVDGLSVCRYLHARDAAVPIVLVTGIEEVRAEALAAGAVQVLAKPCDHHVLAGALSSALRPALRAS